MIVSRQTLTVLSASVAFISILLPACQKSTDPTEDLENRLYISLTDADNNQPESVGLHFCLDYSCFYQKRMLSNSQSAGIIQPAEFALYQNFPNPFNPQTTIAFAMPQVSSVTLQILDGSDSTVIKTLVNGNLPAGYHQVLWDGTNDAGDYVTNHVYPYRLQSGTFSETRQLFINMADAE
jgi:hypothetical protein